MQKLDESLSSNASQTDENPFFVIVRANVDTRSDVCEQMS